MQVAATNKITMEQFQAFFGQEIGLTDDIQMKQFGYFVYDNKVPVAFFSLFPVDKNSYWLRAFVMKQGMPLTFPMTLIQLAEELVKEYGANQLFIHSKSQLVTDLVSQLGYTQTDRAPTNMESGQWWISIRLHHDEFSKTC
ncbi:hypothetical protein ACFOZ1_01630 [Gracilibacillus marinus]|uniref:N-acetyltransferase domain-containing protein n=1 Tax=Gracilibacillus marinus TaxID=630535 RepID=A0ABV8VTY4_9BACI